MQNYVKNLVYTSSISKISHLHHNLFMIQLVAFMQTLCQPTCDLHSWALRYNSKVFVSLFTIYGVRHSSEGGLFFVWCCRTGLMQGKESTRPKKPFSALATRLLELRTDERERRRKSNSEGSHRYYAETLSLAKLNHAHQQPLPTWHLSSLYHIKDLIGMWKGFPLALSMVPSPVLDLKCHIRSY